MRPARPPWIALVVVGLLAGCAVAPPDPASGDGDGDTIATRLLGLVNDARATGRTCGDLGRRDAVAPLVLDGLLLRAARLHSEDMRATGTLSHVGADGSTPAERVEREGYPWRRVAENVARGYATPEAAVGAWLASDGHCANLMLADVSELGAGEDGGFWTLLLAERR
jgi:uncharacterized protein YkwD